MSNKSDSSSKIRRILSLLNRSMTCPICLELLNNPAMSMCNHTFCKFCIENYFGRKTSASCPICKENISKRGLTYNEKMKDIAIGVRKVIQAWEKDTNQTWVPNSDLSTSVLSQEASQSLVSMYRTSEEDLPCKSGEISDGSNVVNHGRVKGRGKGRASKGQSRQSLTDIGLIPPPPPIQASTPAVDLQWKPEWEPDVNQMEEKLITGTHVDGSGSKRRNKTRGRGPGLSVKDLRVSKSPPVIKDNDDTGNKELSPNSGKFLRDLCHLVESAEPGKSAEKNVEKRKDEPEVILRERRGRKRLSAAEPVDPADEPQSIKFKKKFKGVDDVAKEAEIDDDAAAITENSREVAMKARSRKNKVFSSFRKYGKKLMETKNKQEDSECIEIPDSHDVPSTQNDIESSSNKPPMNDETMVIDGTESCAIVKDDAKGNKPCSLRRSEQFISEQCIDSDSKPEPQKKGFGLVSAFRRSKRKLKKTASVKEIRTEEVNQNINPVVQIEKIDRPHSTSGRVPAGGNASENENDENLPNKTDAVGLRPSRKPSFLRRRNSGSYKLNKMMKSMENIPAVWNPITDENKPPPNKLLANSRRIDRSISANVLTKTTTILENVSKSESPTQNALNSVSMSKKRRWSRSTSTVIPTASEKVNRRNTSISKFAHSKSTFGLPPRPYNPETSSNESSPMLPLAQRLSSEHRKTSANHPTSPRTPKEQLLTPYRVYGATGPPSANQRSAERIIKKYSIKYGHYPLLPSYSLKQDHLVSKSKLSSKSPGWSRHKQMRKDMTLSSKRPLSVQRTWLTLNRRSYSPAAKSREVSPSKGDSVKRSGRKKERMMKIIQRFRSRSRSKSRTRRSRVEPVNSNNAVSLDETPANMIDLSTLPLDDNVEESKENSVCQSQAKTNNSQILSSQNDDDDSKMILCGDSESVMIPGTQGASEIASSGILGGQTAMESEDLGDVDMVADSEVQMIRQTEDDRTSSKLQQSRVTAQSLPKLHPTNELLSMRSTTSCSELRDEKNYPGVQLKLSADGRSLSFIRNGNIVRQVSVVDVWRRYQEAELVPPLSQETEDVNPSQTLVSVTTIGSQDTTPPMSQITESEPVCQENVSSAQVLFSNKDLYCTDSDEAGENDDVREKESRTVKKVDEASVSSEEATRDTPSTSKRGSRSRRRIKRIESDEDDSPSQSQETRKSNDSFAKQHDFEVSNSEAFYTTQQRHNLHREVQTLEQQLNELQALERLIEAEPESDDVSAIPDSVALPEDDIVVRLTLGMDKEKSQHSNTKQLTSCEEREVEDEPIVIPSSQDEVQTDVSSDLVRPKPQASFQDDRRGYSPAETNPHCEVESSSPQSVETKPIYLVASGLRPEDKESLKKFCRRFEAYFSSVYEPGRTTHVVMREDGSRPRVVQRTLKFFLGILGKSWVVSFQWIRDCMFTDTLMEEDDYEIVGDSVCGVSHGGPKRARTMKRQIFTGLYLCVVGELIDLPHEEFKLMVELGGGHCIPSPGKFPREARKRFIIVDRQSQDFSLTACKSLFKRFRVPIVTRDWLFDSIARYCLFQPTGDYIIEASGSLKQ